MPPPFPSAPQPPICGFHGPGVVVSEAVLRDAVVAAAVAEQTKWFGTGGTLATEGADGQFGHLVRYWLAQNASIPPATLGAAQTAISAGIAYGQLLTNTATDAALRTAARAVRASLLASAPTANNPANIDDLVEEALLRAVQSRRDTGPFTAWSGVFVVSCIRSVAIQLQLEVVSGNLHEGIDGLLLASFRHSEYVIEAFDRRFRTPARNGTYHAFNPSERVVKRGDIIVQDRRTPLRINGVTRFADIPGMGRRELHCDIVTDVRSGEAEAIGGNLGQSVRKRLYPLNANGQLLIVNRRQLYTQEDSRRRLPPLPEDRSRLASTSTGRIFALLSPVERCVAAPPPVGALNVTRGKTVSLREVDKRSPWPMSARQGFTTESFEQLESPFFDEEILQPQPRNEFESNVERMVAESPFMDAFDARYSLGATAESSFLQSFAEDFLSPDEPETHEVGEIEEVELWEPFTAESEPEEDEDLATEGPAGHLYGFTEEAPLNEEREEPEGFLANEEEAQYDDEEGEPGVAGGDYRLRQAVSRIMPKMASRIDVTFDYAAKLKPLADRVPAPVATTPEIEFDQPVRRKPSPPQPVCSGPSATTGHWLNSFTVSDQTIPRYKDAGGKLQATDCSIYVPDAAWKEKKIDLLVFFHGDRGPCLACFDPDPKITSKKFGLDAQIENSKRKIALAVPRVFWNGNDVSQVKGKWSAANFNRFVQDVLNEIGIQSSQTPALGNLIIAGHSRAYNILTPLAREFNQGAPATTTGNHLANLAEVWALDSTYGQKHVRALDAWASARPNVRFIAVLYNKGSRLKYWNSYYKDYSFDFGPPPNLRMCSVEEGAGLNETHCRIPTKYIGNLLLTTKSSADWCKP